MHTKPNEIISDLEDQGYTVTSVNQLISKRTKLELPFFLITMPRNELNLTVFDLTHLGFMQVKIEGYSVHGTTQCFNCNNFFHTAANCHMITRCLKCGKEHPTKKCDIKERQENPYCINFNAYGHTACYTKCPNFRKPRKGYPLLNRNNKKFTSNNVVEGISFANMVSGNKNNNDSPSPVTSKAHKPNRVLTFNLLVRHWSLTYWPHLFIHRTRNTIARHPQIQIWDGGICPGSSYQNKVGSRRFPNGMRSSTTRVTPRSRSRSSHLCHTPGLALHTTVAGKCPSSPEDEQGQLKKDFTPCTKVILRSPAAKDGDFQKFKLACIAELQAMPDHHPDEPFYRRAVSELQVEETINLAVSDLASFPPCVSPGCPHHDSGLKIITPKNSPDVTPTKRVLNLNSNRISNKRKRRIGL
ncbi:uncharacterized protein TNCV_762571 [Trichonephila clavipes]|nr:uncharacterized protein TNCV_762571 [Trichonephila clavipes]